MVIADASASLRLLSHLFLISVLFDACINNLGEPVFDDVSVVILMTCLQVATPFITLVIFYYMAMRIDLTSQGQFGQIFSRFRFFFIASPAHLAIIAALRGGYKLQHANNITPYIHMWTDSSFKGLFVAQKLVSMLYYVAAVRAVFMILKLNTQRQLSHDGAPRSY